MKESPADPQENSGEFDAFCEKGDVKGLYFGHDHNNAFHGDIRGIDVGYARVPGSMCTARDWIEVCAPLRCTGTAACPPKTCATGTGRQKAARAAAFCFLPNHAHQCVRRNFPSS